MRESEEKKLLNIITYPPREAERKKKEAMHIDQMKKTKEEKIMQESGRYSAGTLPIGGAGPQQIN